MGKVGEASLAGHENAVGEEDGRPESRRSEGGKSERAHAGGTEVNEKKKR